MGKKRMTTLSFADLTGGKKKVNIGKKKVKKAAKYHSKEMTIGKKKFKKMNEEMGKKETKKELAKYRRDHANSLADILLSGRLKNPEKFEEKLQEAIEDGKLFDANKKSHMKKVSKKQPGLFAYTHIIDPIDGEMVKIIMNNKVEKLQGVVDEKTAVKVAPLAAKSDASKVLRVMMKVATEKDSSSFDAKEFFQIIRPKNITKKEWKELIVTTVLGIRGYSNNATKDITNYAITLLGNMPKDRIKKILRRYADSITKVADSGEKLNFLVSIKDLSDDHKIEKVLNDNPKIANVIGQI